MRRMPLRALRFVPDPLSRLSTSFLSLSPSMPAASPLTPPSTADRSFCSYADRAWKYQTMLTRSCKRGPPAVHPFTNHDHHASRLARALKHHTSPHIRACPLLTLGRGDVRNFRALLYTFLEKSTICIIIDRAVPAPCDSKQAPGSASTYITHPSQILSTLITLPPSLIDLLETHCFS